MSLDQIKFESFYSVSMGHNLLDSLYVPCLKNSIQYDRIAGFFSPKALSAAAEGMATFINNGGKYRLILSKHLFSEEDYEAIKDGYNEEFNEEFKGCINELRNMLKDRPRKILGWMIANGHLEIKIAIKRPDNALLHSKWGNFQDTEGNRLNYNGSINETEHAWTRQVEYTDVFCSWNENDKIRVNQKFDLFDTLWNNEAPNINVLEFTEVQKNEFTIDNDIENKEQCIEQCNAFDIEVSVERKEKLEIIEDRDKPPSPYKYQEDAINAWINNGYKGIFALATGLGKTYAAIFSMIEYAKTVNNKYLTVVVVPTGDLLNQWEKEFKKFDLNGEILRENKNWQASLDEKISYLNLELDGYENSIILVTYNIYCQDNFINHINECNIKKILICDEAHKSGSNVFKKGLLDIYDARLALTATPKRHFDEPGTDFIDSYFGGVVADKDLEWGIKNNYLCPYNYHVTEIDLTQDEQEEYNKITAAMMRLYRKDEIVQSIGFYAKAGERADIIKEAKNKIIAFEENLVELDYKLDGAFIFCHSEVNNKSEDLSQFNKIANILTNNRIRYKPITSKRDMVTRKENLIKFSQGKSDVILAIDCLDEGIDVPSAKMAFILSSTTNEKQYIQRRGRVLRKSGDNKIAEIYDYVCFPSSHTPSGKKMEQNLIKKQLERAKEFAKIANNSKVNLDFINLIASRWEIKLDE